MRTEKLDYINVSSVNDFNNDRLRWCYKWVENRVPRYTPAALKVGKLVHAAFEAHFNTGVSVADALLALIPPPGTFLTDREQKEADLARNLVEPLEFWKDNYPIEQTLEVEQPFVGWHLTSGARFIGRPDRVVVVYGKVFHQQHKTVGPGIDVGNYLTLAGRNMHELLYGAYLSQKYRSVGEYGGSIYDIVRKLKYRSTRITKAEPKGVILHPAGEIFHQSMFALDVEQQEIALDDLNAASVAMDRTMDAYLQGLHIPSNRYFDSVNYGKGIDPYTLVMLGDAALDDDALFMDREELYGSEEAPDQHTDSD